MKTVLTIAIVVVVVSLAACVFLRSAESRMLYQRTPESNPPGGDAFWLQRDEAVRLKIWRLHPDARSALLYFGGNAEDVAHNLPVFDRAFPGRAVYLVNYRGYGGSTGIPSEAALVGDAGAVFDWVKGHHDSVIVMGRSLGSGVATALAADRPVERLILVTPFDSIANVAGEQLTSVARSIVTDRYDSAKRMSRVHADVLVVVAARDEVISRARSDALIAAVNPASRHVVTIPSAGHNDLDRFPAYLSSVEEFVAKR
jgi:pimeloyl-ACP methyl ester carboxylesterase